MGIEKSEMEIKLDMYKTLYERYAALAGRLMDKAKYTANNYGTPKKRMKLMESIGDFEKYSYFGILYKNEITTIRNLEGILGIKRLPDNIK